METSSERDYQDRRVGPTVSKEKWLNHARTKMARGYTLIVGKQRRTANFYLRSKGYEMCPYNVAKQLIKEGIVVEAGEHHLGTVYKLRDDIQPVPIKRVVDIDEDETPDEVEGLLEELTDDTGDEDEETETD